MCVTRAGRVLALEGAKAKVLFMDTGKVGEVDVSMVDARKNSYVEVFAEHAIGRITKKEAEFKRDLRLEMDRMRAAAP
jgi:hydrogenase maturation factor